MSHAHTDEIKRTFCEQLGEDIDAEVCEEVMLHLESCPDCRVQFDSIKQTIKFYRKVRKSDDALPEAVEERLYKVLNFPR